MEVNNSEDFFDLSDLALYNIENNPNCKSTAEWKGHRIESIDLTDFNQQTDQRISQLFPSIISTNSYLTDALLSSLSQEFDEPQTGSHRLATIGNPTEELLILGINGVNTSLADAKSNQAYIKSLIPGNHGVDYIYNHSNSYIIDILEVFFLNYNGYSPNTARLLIEAWTHFHTYHQDNPSKKILQPCHSQGAIHVYNALLQSPQEIRDRVLVIAIAPGKVVPTTICYDSYNYVSKKDFLHCGEILFFNEPATDERGLSEHVVKTLEHYEQLILLDPDPNAVGIDHYFQSLTFKAKLTEHLQKYIEQNGEYCDS
jgi:hypothetical protein